MPRFILLLFAFVWLGVDFQYYVYRSAGKNVSEIICFVLSGTLNRILFSQLSSPSWLVKGPVYVLALWVNG